jgi:methylenetetrahydrofolate--tRNA-(uracil-5-)-methyltransferase
MNREVYDRFVEALNRSEKALVHPFERKYLFEGCLPIEEMAERGRETLAFGLSNPLALLIRRQENSLLPSSS